MILEEFSDVLPSSSRESPMTLIIAAKSDAGAVLATDSRLSDPRTGGWVDDFHKARRSPAGVLIAAYGRVEQAMAFLSRFINEPALANQSDALAVAQSLWATLNALGNPPQAHWVLVDGKPDSPIWSMTTDVGQDGRQFITLPISRGMYYSVGHQSAIAEYLQTINDVTKKPIEAIKIELTHRIAETAKMDMFIGGPVHIEVSVL